MISHEVYNVIHIIGIVALMAGLGGVALLAMVDPGRVHAGPRRLVTILHGSGAFLVLLGGFGMLARLGIISGGFPGWMWVKLGIWGLLGISPLLLKRQAGSARFLLLMLPVLGGLAAYMAIYKPI